MERQGRVNSVLEGVVADRDQHAKQEIYLYQHANKPQEN